MMEESPPPPKEPPKIKTKLFNPYFEKEPLQFKIEQNNAETTPLVNELQSKLENSASNVLYHWKTVPVVFPPSLIGLDNRLNDKNEVINYQIEYNDLFKQPTFNELDELATDENGKRKRLSKKQLESVKKDGAFEVDSLHFPGKTHRWVLTKLLQKGYVPSNKTFFINLAFALKFLIITAKNRFTAKCFSIRQALSAWKYGIWRLLDLMIGMRNMEDVDYTENLREEYHKFMVQELLVDPLDQKKYDEMCRLTNLALKDKKFKVKFEIDRSIIPYHYLTPNNERIDFRLADKKLIQKLEPILIQILTNSKDQLSKLNKLRQSTILQLRSDGMSDEMIAKMTTDVLQKEYINRVLKDLLEDQEIERIAPGIGKTLYENAKTVLLVRDVCMQVNTEMEEHLSEFRAKLEKKYRIKSLINEWMEKELEKERQEFKNKNSFTAIDRALQVLKNENLNQSHYFMNREKTFVNESQKKLDEYKKAKIPSREFHFNRMIWFPKNYKISSYDVAGTTRYSLTKYSEYSSNTKYPFWRWRNFFVRTWVYFLNSLFIFGIVIPFVSAVSYRALFSCSPYYPEKILDQDGKLIPDPASKKRTYVSRLRSIWDDAKRSRDRFESTPDKGLIGKTISRFFNRTWNYIIKGVFGSIGLTLIFIPLCLFVSTISLMIAMFTPIWYPILSVLQHVSFVLFYDWDCANSKYRFAKRIFPLFDAVFFRMITLGSIMPALALFTAIVICPLISLVVTILAIIQKVFRKIWDTIMFYTLLKCKARVPSHDTFVARRVAGPGLASEYFFQIKPEQALAALEADLEIRILRAYIENIEKRLYEPVKLYSDFFNPIFTPFSYGLHSGSGPYSKLSKEVQEKLSEYQSELSKRTTLVERIRTNADLTKVRLNESDLKILLSESIKLVRKHFSESILPYRNLDADKLFRDKDIDEGDWSTFTGSILEEIFGAGILTPLEETHCYFSLEVQHLNLEKYARMIAESGLRDDLDCVLTRYNPQKGHNPIPLPQPESMQLFTFDAQLNPNHVWDPESRKQILNSNLTIPTSLPDDAVLIAIITQKHRDKEPQISFESFRYLKNRPIQLTDADSDSD